MTYLRYKIKKCNKGFCENNSYFQHFVFTNLCYNSLFTTLLYNYTQVETIFQPVVVLDYYKFMIQINY